jgi:O-antigen ligase
VIAGFAFLALLLTKSRTAFLSLVVVQLWLWTTDAESRPQRAFLAVGLSSVASIMALALLIAPTFIPSTLLLGRDTDVGSLDGRDQLWAALAPYLQERPLTGFGYGAFWTPQRITDISASQGWGVGEAHSSYLELLLALGVPGALLLAAALLSIWLASRRKILPRSSYVFTISILGFFMVNSLSESAAYGTPELQFLLFWGVAQFIVGPGFRMRAVPSIQSRRHSVSSPALCSLGEAVEQEGHSR